MKLDYKQQIGNSILVNPLNAKCSMYESKLRERWNGRFQGLKDYNRQNRDDNYVVVKTGAWFSKRKDCWLSNRYIVVNGNRYYLNYQNSITGDDEICTLYLVDIDALEQSKPYKFNPKFDEDKSDEYKDAKFDSFKQLRQLAKQQYEHCNNQIPTITVIYTRCYQIADSSWCWDYKVTSNATDTSSEYTICNSYSR